MAERRGAQADGELLGSMAEGDREAFEELFRRFAPWLRGLLGQRCTDPVLVDEVVQDVFVEIWRHREHRRGKRVEQVDNVSGWLWRIAQRRLIDAQRAQERRGSLLRRLGSLPKRHVISAEDELLAQLGDGALAAVELLPADLKAVVKATSLDGLTVREAAEQLRIPTGTVKSRTSRARRLLKERLLP
ncbi:RNA polymerase sigma factor [Streptomyces albipurpureus]|uniref:RNA polymerase sigma factor n=1 Tax=Streptomyces albipurpureus TaxID=2897419 RepID=A0ABT0UNT4_9ACTN|nr:RNA polymerase sigma factor [Streptomyces sp. CWNU-1]MCM2388916.1 RNA polymerase sigma factor [Streptomyces sp. CWNU-1]